jgi:hypothetical protein
VYIVVIFHGLIISTRVVWNVSSSVSGGVFLTFDNNGEVQREMSVYRLSVTTKRECSNMASVARQRRVGQETFQWRNIVIGRSITKRDGKGTALLGSNGGSCLLIASGWGERARENARRWWWLGLQRREQQQHKGLLCDSVLRRVSERATSQRRACSLWLICEMMVVVVADKIWADSSRRGGEKRRATVHYYWLLAESSRIEARQILHYSPNYQYERT